MICFARPIGETNPGQQQKVFVQFGNRRQPQSRPKRRTTTLNEGNQGSRSECLDQKLRSACEADGKIRRMLEVLAELDQMGNTNV
jgi:hypothetical protein